MGANNVATEVFEQKRDYVEDRTVIIDYKH